MTTADTRFDAASLRSCGAVCTGSPRRCSSRSSGRRSRRSSARRSTTAARFSTPRRPARARGRFDAAVQPVAADDDPRSARGHAGRVFTRATCSSATIRGSAADTSQTSRSSRRSSTTTGSSRSLQRRPPGRLRRCARSQPGPRGVRRGPLAPGDEAVLAGRPKRDTLRDDQRERARIGHGPRGHRRAGVANEVGARRLLPLFAEYDLDDPSELSTSCRTAPSGRCARSSRRFPTAPTAARAGRTPKGQPTRMEVAVTIDGDEIVVDYAGTGPQLDFGGTNCTLTYTTATPTTP